MVYKALTGIGALAYGAWKLGKKVEEELESYGQDDLPNDEDSFARPLARSIAKHIRERAEEIEDMQLLYKSMGLRSSQIRVVDLEPGAFDDPLRCGMAVVHFANGGYEALSYTWGDLPPSLPLQVHKAACTITPSLDTALRYLRPSSGRPRRLWIDAVCTNQSDALDKNGQLPRMGQIYNFATQVLVWLGPPDIKSARARSYFRTLCESDPDLSKLVESRRTEPEKWSDFADSILTSPWWGRAWIVQEFIMACRVEMFRGYDKWDANEVLLLASCIHQYPMGETFRVPARTWKEQRDRRAVYLLSGTRSLKRARLIRDDLCYWLARFHGWDCSHKLDHIYAFIGIAGHCSIKPDIQREEEWPEVYAEVAYTILGERESLDYIFIGHGARRSELLAATWIPDLQGTYEDGARFPPLDCGNGAVFSASKAAKFRVSRTGDSHILRARGLQFATVQGMDAPYTDEDDTIARLDAAFALIGRSGTERYPFQPAHSYKVAFGRTLCWDLNFERERLTSDDPMDGDGPTPDYHPELDEPLRQSHFHLAISESFDGMWRRRRFAVLDNGALAMLPASTCRNDVVTVLAGASVPMILRPGGKAFEFVGECYVHGIMDGESWPSDEKNLDDFYLI